MIKVKKSHLWFVLSVVFVWWRVRGNRENFILSITVSGSVWVLGFGFWFFAFTFFQPNERKTIFVVFVSSVVHTHIHIKKEKYIKTSKDKKLMRFYCICVGSLNNTWGKKPANTYDLKVNNAQKGKLWPRVDLWRLRQSYWRIE